MEHWLDSSAFIKANEAELSPAEITAVDFLMNAWRNHDFSPELSAEAKENIDILVQNDELHGNSPKLKTQVQRFRGVASTIYTSDAETYEQFRTELGLRMGVNPTRTATSDSSPSPSPSHSRTSPPPPPPPSGVAQLDVTDAALDILSLRGAVLRSFTTVVPEGRPNLRPAVKFSTTVVGSRWKVTCRLLDPMSREVATSVNDCAVNGSSGTLLLKEFSSLTLKPGGYRLIVYVNGDKRLDQPVTVTADNSQSSDAYTLKIKNIASTDAAGNQVSPKILTTAQFLTPTLDITAQIVENQHIKLQINIYSPSGKLMRDEQSPVGCTYVQTIDFRGSDTLTLRTWGNNNGKLFAEEGTWRMEIKLPDGRIVMYRFNVERPHSLSSPLEIYNVDFYLPDTRKPAQVANDNNYAEAPKKLTSLVSPRIEFSLNNAVEVAEISYVIYKHTDVGPREIFRSASYNYAIGGRRTLLLEQSQMMYEQFVPGAYSIKFIVNGLPGPNHEFTVPEKAEIPWGKVGAVAFIIAMFAIGFLM